MLKDPSHSHTPALLNWRAARNILAQKSSVPHLKEQRWDRTFLGDYRQPVGRSPLLLTIILAIILAGCGGNTMLSAYLRTHQAELDQPTSVDDSPVRFIVELGTPARVIGQNLQAAGLITDDLLFEAYVRVNGLAARLEAGTFVLNPSMTMIEIVDALQNAEAASVLVTIPEGWRYGQIVDHLNALAILTDGAEYERQVSTGDISGLDPARYSFLQSRPAGTSLEGYLFPDTYNIAVAEAVATDVLQRQLDTFAARVVPIYEEAVQAGATDLDLYTVLILASIVEREAVIADERPAIAGVYLNRLRNGIKLEADPTVQYAMGYQPAADQWWKTPVFLEEYSSVNSPYNTYLYPGLPPGPIANPGLSSIQAVLSPEDHDFIFFVALPEEGGRHVFARTYEEHVENVRNYQGR